MTILDKIAQHKVAEVAKNKTKFPISILEKNPFFSKTSISFKAALLDESKLGIIAEFKKKSPSKGIINASVTVEQTTKGYIEAGASVLSVLTDSEFFGGSNSDLIKARETNKNSPILRKDFIIDEYQIIEAKSIGADVILLIAAILTPKQIKEFALFAKKSGLEILLEVHNKEELERSVNEYIDVIGVNNRNLNDFTVDIQKSFELVELIPSNFIKISESALNSAKIIHELKAVGYKGFLIGETFMKQVQPEKALAEFIREVREWKN